MKTSTTPRLDRSHETPLYEQVREHLREYCLAKGPNTPLAPVREMCESLGVNQSTLTRALRDLETDGLLRIIPRKGTFVAAAPRATVELLVLLGEVDALGPIAQQFLSGMQEACTGEETIAATTMTSPPYPDPKKFAEHLRLRQVGALAVCGHDYRDFPTSLEETNFIYALSQLLPVVLLGKPHRHLELDCVYADARPVMLEWMQKCYDKGVRRFGYITTGSNAVHYQERFEAFRQFHLDHALQWHREFIPTAESGADDEAQREKTPKLLKLDSLPEAIVAASISSAYQLVLETHRRGLKPGEDIHILCFSGNRSMQQAVEPYASIIVLPEAEVGRSAMQRIAERWNGTGQAAPCIRRLPATLQEPAKIAGSKRSQRARK
jgi:DNA-binding LacI/PurR family transcriptional regulator